MFFWKIRIIYIYILPIVGDFYAIERKWGGDVCDTR